MYIRTAILTLAMTGMTQSALAHDPAQKSENTMSNEMSTSMIIPLKKVGGKWVASFDVFNGSMFAGGGSEMPVGPDDFVVQGSLEGFAMEGGEAATPEPLEEGALPDGFGELPPGAEVFAAIPGGGEMQAYTPTYLVVDLSATFTLSLTEEAVDDLELTGAHPIMLVSPHGSMTSVPIEDLEVYDDEKALKAIAADSKKVLGDGKVIGALGKKFFEGTHPVLDQKTHTLTLKIPTEEQPVGGHGSSQEEGSKQKGGTTHKH